MDVVLAAAVLVAVGLAFLLGRDSGAKSFKKAMRKRMTGLTDGKDIKWREPQDKDAL